MGGSLVSSREELTNEIAEAMRRFIADTVLLNERIAAALGLNVVDLQTFSVIRSQQEALTPGEVSKRTGLPASTTTRVLDRLESAGFVERRPHPTDRRGVLLAARPEKVAEADAQYSGILAALEKLHEEFTPAELDVISRYLTTAIEDGRFG